MCVRTCFAANIKVAQTIWRPYYRHKWYAARSRLRMCLHIPDTLIIMSGHKQASHDSKSASQVLAEGRFAEKHSITHGKCKLQLRMRRLVDTYSGFVTSATCSEKR